MQGRTMSLTEPTREIETKHLTLRTPRFCDCERIATLANDRDIVTMTGRMPWPYGLDDAKAFVAAVQSQDARHNATFLIELKNEGPIGVIGLFMANDPVPEIGYWIGKPYWGRGLASEALKATTHWAHGHWQRRALMAGHFTDNPASGRVLDKAGFLYTGEIRPLFSKARNTLCQSRMMVWMA